MKKTFLIYITITVLLVLLIAGCTPSGPATCDDTDGLDPFIKGYTTNERGTVEDVCVTDPDTGITGLIEYYCNGDARISASMACNCEDGRCAKFSITEATYTKPTAPATDNLKLTLTHNLNSPIDLSKNRLYFEGNGIYYNPLAEDTSEGIIIQRAGDNLNLGEYLNDIQDTPLTDDDLIYLLADGTYVDTAGENENTETYTQQLELPQNAHEMIFEAEDDDDEIAAVYLKLNEGLQPYVYTLEFDSPVQYNNSEAYIAEQDWEGTSLEIQGRTYTITDIALDPSLATNKKLDSLTMETQGSNGQIIQVKFVDGQEVEINDIEVDDSEITFDETIPGRLEGLTISYELDDDMWLAEGESMIDPVLGNFKVTFNDWISQIDDIELNAYSSGARLTFINPDGALVDIPFWADINAGSIYLGENNNDERILLQGQVADCMPGSSSMVTDCEGMKLWVVDLGENTHLVEITDINSDDMEISFEDITYSKSYQNRDLVLDSEAYYPLGDIGNISLFILSNGMLNASRIQLDDLPETNSEATLDIGIIPGGTASARVLIIENNDEDNNFEIDLKLTVNTVNDTVEAAVSNILPVGMYADYKSGPHDESATNNDIAWYATEWGTLIRVDTKNKQWVQIDHPYEQAYAEVIVSSVPSMDNMWEANTPLTLDIPGTASAPLFTDTQCDQGYFPMSVLPSGLQIPLQGDLRYVLQQVSLTCQGVTTCVDTDGGVDYLTSGYCTDSTGTYYDECSGPTDAAPNDWHCVNDVCTVSAISNCPDWYPGTACSSGACLDSQGSTWVGGPLRCRIEVGSPQNFNELALKLITDEVTRGYSTLHLWADESGNISNEIYSNNSISLVPPISGEWGDWGLSGDEQLYYGYHQISLPNLALTPGYYWVGVTQTQGGLSALNIGVFNDGNLNTYSEDSTTGMYRRTDWDCYYILN